MSRGLGKRELAVLSALRKHPNATAKDVARSITGGDDYSLTEFQAIWRALKTLVAKHEVVRTGDRYTLRGEAFERTERRAYGTAR